jgi:hypothetical protein
MGSIFLGDNNFFIKTHPLKKIKENCIGAGDYFISMLSLLDKMSDDIKKLRKVSNYVESKLAKS